MLDDHVSWNHNTADLEIVFAEMKRQRKMGHITIVGSSMGIVEGHLKSLLKEDKSDGLYSCFIFSHHLLFYN